MQNPRGSMRQELVTWEEVDKIVDILLPQINMVGGFDGIMMITRGGIVPGGLLAEALNMTYVLTAAVRFPDYLSEFSHDREGRYALPSFLQFPDRSLVEDRKLLLVDDVWGSGRTSTSIRGRLEASDAKVYTCVFHYNPQRSLFQDSMPDFYGVITDAYVIYPWEADRGLDGIESPEVQF